MAKKEKALVPVKYNKNFSVVQANDLIRSKQDEQTILEARLIRLAISQVVENDSCFRTYSCSIAELANFLGINSSNVYSEIKDIASSLMRKQIFMKTGKIDKKGKPEYKIFHWIDYAEYSDGNIMFRLSESIAPYLLGLSVLFTNTELGQSVSIPTYYALRLYELLSSWHNSTLSGDYPKTNYTNVKIEADEIIFTIDWLREYFICEEKYKQTRDFISNVIDKSVNALNENSMLFMKISYRTVKEGKAIKYIVFKFVRPAGSLSDFKLYALDGEEAPFFQIP